MPETWTNTQPISRIAVVATGSALKQPPHYLQFADRVAPLMHETLPGVALIFLLREPASRLFTVFRNLREVQSRTFGNWTFDRFVEQAIKYRGQPDHHADDPNLRAANYMHTGCYAKYLATYLEIFDPSRIRICFFDNLISSPRIFMSQVTDFLGIDGRFYDAYRFTQENKTRSYRFHSAHQLAHKINQTIEPILNKHPGLRKMMRGTYNLFNEAKGKKEAPSEKSKALLHEFYELYNADLRVMLEKNGQAEGLPAWLTNSDS